MTSFKERVQLELDGLNMEIQNLEDFILSSNFDKLPYEEQRRLRYQLTYMGQYQAVLILRIEDNFGI